MRQIVIAGGSNAGLSAARELRRAGFDGRVVLLDADAQSPYRRPEVSKGLLSGKLDEGRVAIEWPGNLEVERLMGHRLVRLDLGRRQVEAIRADGGDVQVPFDGLVIATGARARPVPFGPRLPGVHTLRSVEDARGLRKDLREARRVVIVGGGFIGLEVAAVAAELGQDVTVVEKDKVPLGSVLGASFGAYVTALHRSHGVRIVTGGSVAGLVPGPSGRVAGVRLVGGEPLAADVVLVAIGSLPGVDWLIDSGLDVTDGVRCDRTCAVAGADGVVAAGDVAAWWNPLYSRLMRVEHWTNAVEQGAYAARRLLGLHDPAGFVSAPYFWSDQYGARLQSIGSSLGHDAALTLESDGPKLVVAYARAGRLLSVAGIHASAAVMGHRSQVLSRISIEDLECAV
ncbi:NAD(P)/FAD-dependent oxidoreductase [Frankia canadensis]|nr:FAD-dependent oxidoreductase [Frankia canadensis]